MEDTTKICLLCLDDGDKMICDECIDLQKERIEYIKRNIFSENVCDDYIKSLWESNKLKYPRHLETFNQFIIHVIDK